MLYDYIIWLHQSVRASTHEFGGATNDNIWECDLFRLFQVVQGFWLLVEFGQREASAGNIERETGVPRAGWTLDPRPSGYLLWLLFFPCVSDSRMATGHCTIPKLSYLIFLGNPVTKPSVIIQLSPISFCTLSWCSQFKMLKIEHPNTFSL